MWANVRAGLSSTAVSESNAREPVQTQSQRQSPKYVLLRRKDNALHLVQHFAGGTTAKVGA